MNDFAIDVKTRIKASNYKVLVKAAEANETTIDALVAEIVRRAVEPKKKRNKRLTPEQVSRIQELSKLHYSDREIGKRMGVSESTAQRYRVMLNIPASRIECTTETKESK